MRIRIALVGVLALLLAGCTAATGSPSPSPTPVVLHHSATLTPPKGARSADIRVVCAGPGVELTVDADPAPRTIGCTAPRNMTVALGPRLALTFGAEDGATFTATVRYSPKVWKPDAALGRQCWIASTAYSDVASAQNGLAGGQLDIDGADALVRQAEATVSSGPFDGPAGEDLAALRTWIDAHPGGDPRAVPLPTHILRLCEDNTTPVIVATAYGG